MVEFRVASLSTASSLDHVVVSKDKLYKLDGGVSTDATFVFPSRVSGWLDGYDSGGSDWITSVSNIWGDDAHPALAGAPAQLALWNDPTNGNDSSDAVLLWSIDVTTPGVSAQQIYEVSPPSPGEWCVLCWSDL